jgi:hypothetical protein
MTNIETENTEKERLTTSTPPRPSDIDRIPEPAHPTKTTKVFNLLALASLAVIAIGLIILLRWSLVDTNVLKVNNAPFPVRTIRQHAENGGVVILSVDLCKNTNVSGTVRTSFISQTREIFLPVSQERIQKGCLAQEIPIVVPKDLPSDTYKIKFRATYDLNPLKKGIVSEFESKTFQIDPNLPTTP